MKRRTFAVLITLLTLLLSSSAAWASRLQLEPVAVTQGRDMPAIIVTPGETITSLSGTMAREDGQKVALSARNIAGGSKHKLTVRQEAGTVFRYDGVITINWAAGDTSKHKFSFTLARMNKIKLDLKPENIDLDARHMSFTLNNPAKMCELTIVGQDGQPLKTIKRALGAAKAGSVLSVDWPEIADVLYMDIKVYDLGDYWTGMRLTPFAIEGSINIEFDSGKWDIRPSEEPKLKEKIAEINDLMRKFGKSGLQANLYIAGFTDTVGDAGSNRRLSNNRARSIGSWFRSHGLRMPIFYQGFGEDVLAVDTPDNSDEQRNRRVLFVFSSATPSGKNFPKKDWSKL